MLTVPKFECDWFCSAMSAHAGAVNSLTTNALCMRVTLQQQCAASKPHWGSATPVAGCGDGSGEQSNILSAGLALG